MNLKNMIFITLLVIICCKISCIICGDSGGEDITLTFLKNSLQKLERKQTAQDYEMEILRNKLKIKDDDSKVLKEVAANLKKLHESHTKLLEVETRYRSKREAAIDLGQLAFTVDFMKQELLSIKSLEDQSQDSAVLESRLAELAKITEDLAAQLHQVRRQSTSSTDQVTAISYIPGHMEKMGRRLQEMQEKISELEDVNRWLEYSYKQQNAEFDTMKQTLYAEISKLKQSDQWTTPFLNQKFDSDIIEGSGAGSGESDTIYTNPYAPKWTGQLLQRVRALESKVASQSQSIKSADATMKKLSIEKKYLQKRVDTLTKDSITKQQMRTTLNQLEALERKHEKMSTEIDSILSKQSKLDGNQQRLGQSMKDHVNISNSAQHVATVVRTVQMNHFTKLQNISRKMNEMQTDILTFGLKLTTLQADFLNSTLNLHKTSVKDHQQDIQAVKIEEQINQLKQSFIPDTMANIKELQDQVIRKVEYSTWKELSYFIDLLSSKVGIHSNALQDMHLTQEQHSYAIIGLEDQLPTDCSMNLSWTYASYRTGQYLIMPPLSNRSVTVLCDMRDRGGGWTVVQSRSQGLSFNQSYAQYETGFGTAQGDFWIGNHMLYLLTNASGISYAALFEGWDIYGTHWFAYFGQFSVSGPDDYYRLNLCVGDQKYNSTLSVQSLAAHNGMAFSTWDRDNDASHTRCALYYGSGWWFQHCHKANLNGNFKMGMIWFQNTTGHWLQFKSTRMKIRPTVFESLQ